MSMFQLFILALVQGITEFLPISSSGHLILVPELTTWQDQGLAMDVAVHVGTLGAVMLYFRQDVARLLSGGLGYVGAQCAPQDKRLFGHLVIATIPVVIAGLALKLSGYDMLLRSPSVIAAASIGFGLVLYAADIFAPRHRAIEGMTIKHVLALGFAQVFALIPGASRAGTTMTAARGLGYTRQEAARFSMLMSIPTILAAGALLGLDVFKGGEAIGIDAMIAAALSFIFALAAIHFLMTWLQDASMTIFVLYRVALGIFLFWWFL